MLEKRLIVYLVFLQVFVSNGLEKNQGSTERDNGKGSLVFVFDTTGSMYNDLKQLREGAELILKTALEESSIIEEFVFVPFHDPAVGPATVTRDKEVFKSALNVVRVYGGGDCPERSISGVAMGVATGRPRSAVFVFSDASAARADLAQLPIVLDLIQRKRTQVVFVLTGHCNDLDKPTYKVYHQIAAASSGQVFNLNKTSVHKVLDFVRSSIKARTVNLDSVDVPAGYNFTQGIPVDKSVGEVTVSVSGAKPSIKVVNPSGKELYGPPKLVTTLDLSEIMIVKVMQPVPGNWTITTGSEEDYSVRVVGLSNLTFEHGFSVETPSNMTETSYRPLQGAYNHMLISLTETDHPVHINYAEIVALNGKTLFEIPLKQFGGLKTIYAADPFMPPDDLFYIAINGRDEYNQDLRRIGATAIQAKSPDVPYLTVPRQFQARSNDRVVLNCNVESLVPVTAMWTKDSMGLQKETASLQTSSIQYVITNMSEENVGTYQCVANNIAGQTKASTEVVLLVDPPQVTIAPVNKTVEIGENITVTCTVTSEALLLKHRLVFNGTQTQYAIDIVLEPNVEGYYIYNRDVKNASERDDGVYSCVAANRGGETTQSTFITLSRPQARILGPHTITKHIHTPIQLVCHVENADRVLWEGSNGTLLKETTKSMGSYNDVLNVNNVTDDGNVTCIVARGPSRVSDTVEINVIVEPKVSIVGPKTVTILNGTSYDVVCTITAKPSPRILWHRETEQFLDNNITTVKDNSYVSVLTLNSSKEPIEGTYFCIAENSEGIDEDKITVDVRRAMTWVEKFADKPVELNSEAKLKCLVDSFRQSSTRWYHNGTNLKIDDNLRLSEDNTTMYISQVGFTNLGIYACEVSDGYEVLRCEGRVTVVGLERPVLSKEPVRRVTQKGKSTILTCRVMKGSPEPVLSWQYASNNSANFATLPNDTKLNVNGSEVVIPKIDVRHYGTYRCVAENEVGADVYDVLLIVHYPPQLLKNATENDNPLEVEAGQNITLSCEAVSVPPPIVTWVKDDRPIGYSTNVYVTDDSELTLQQITEHDSGMYSCNATSVLGSLRRNFTLVVYVPPQITPAGIEPVLEIAEGELVSLPCVARGAPRPHVYWLHGGHEVGGAKRVDDFGLRFVANLTDFGEYTCVATNRYGNASVSFTIHIWVAPYIEPPLKMTKDITVGSNITIECNAVGFPIPFISWQFGDEILTDNTTDLSFNEFGAVYINNASAKHDGGYTCIAENLAGIAEKITFLNVNEPPQILSENYTGPYIATNKDLALVLTCRAVGKPKPLIAWLNGDAFVNGDPRYDIDADGTLTIKNPSEELGGLYTCVATNIVGTANKTVSVQIYVTPSRLQAEQNHTTVTVVEGTNATIQCPILASENDTVKWYKNAKLIHKGALQMPNITRHNTSTYACVVTNAVGSASAMVQIDVEWEPKFIEVTTDLDTKTLEVIKGDDVYFDCETDAKPEAKTKWFFNSKELIGEDKPRLRLLSVKLLETGTYKCIVGNVHGTIRKEFVLDVFVPPFISEFDLLDVQLKEGVNATLECKAKGYPTPVIKWRFNNTNWQDQNGTLTSTSITTETDGLYRCEATNKAGRAYLVYRVGVVQAAKVGEVVLFVGGKGVTVPGGVRALLGSHIRIACSATGKPAPIIQWLQNGQVLSGNNDGIEYADLIIDVKLSDAGTYVCVATNEAGVDQREIALEVLEPPKIFQSLFHNANTTGNMATLEVISGQAFYLHCHPYGNPAPDVYWFKDTKPLRLYDDTIVSTEFGEILVVKAAKYEQSGNYTCVARNSVGNASLVYLVDVLVPPQLPKEISTVSARVGQPLSLSCPAFGRPAPTAHWLKHPFDEIGGGRVTFGNDNYNLLINKTEVSDSGAYSCILTNKVGTTEIIFDVVIEKKPTIAGNIAGVLGNVESHIVPLWRSLVLKCQADGNPRPKISWLKDTQHLKTSSNIQQALGNSILAAWNVGSRDAGQYICVVENQAGIAYRRYNVRVQVPGRWSAWSRWSLCNATCGAGAQTRHRRCHYIDDYNVIYEKSTKPDKIILDESACKGSTVDKRKCLMPSCEEDGLQWSPWSRCSVSCGAGTQTRARRCGRNCVKDNLQIRKCRNLPKCDSNSETPENEVYTSGEATESTDETVAYLPEATFEMQPEEIGPFNNIDTGEVYIKTEPQLTIYYDVNITENLDKSERGHCDVGFSVNTTTGACDDIDECLIESNHCHSTQICANTAGGYRCYCPHGFRSLGLNQRCLDVNECEQDTHRCEFACVNVAGGYVCACPSPLRLRTDRHTCYWPSSRQKSSSYEVMGAKGYLSTTIDQPAKYKNSRN